MSKYNHTYTLNNISDNDKKLKAFLNIFNIERNKIIPKNSVVKIITLNSYYFEYSNVVKITCYLHYTSKIKKQNADCCYAFDKFIKHEEFKKLIRKIKLKSLVF